MVTDCQHFDKLWVSALTIVHHKRNLLWPKLRATQIYRYKYFKVRLTKWPISETSPVTSFLGPMISWVISAPDMASVCHIFFARSLCSCEKTLSLPSQTPHSSLSLNHNLLKYKDSICLVMATSQYFVYSRSRYSPCICGVSDWIEAELSLKRPKFLPGQRNPAPEPATTEGRATDHPAHLNPRDSNHSLVFPVPETETENIWNYCSGLIRRGIEYQKCKAAIMQVQGTAEETFSTTSVMPHLNATRRIWFSFARIG